MSSRKDKLVAKIQAALAGAEGKYAAAAAEAAAATKRMDKFDAERAKLQKELDAHLFPPTIKLIEASRSGAVEVAKLAIAHGAEVNRQTPWVDEWAYYDPDFGVNDWYRDIPLPLRAPDLDHDGDTSIMYACEAGHLDVVKLLLEHGAEVEVKGYRAKSPITGELVQQAARGGDAKGGPPVVVSTTLTSACYGGRLEVVRFLLDRGEDPNQTMYSFDEFTSSGNPTAWHPLWAVCQLGGETGAGHQPQAQNGGGLPYAANLPPDARKEALRKRAGKLEVVKLLLARGANPSADSFGKTALFEAARDGFEEAMRALIAAGASPSRADTKDRGDSPLLVAADDDHLATVQLLMVCGADPQYRNRDGEDAYDVTLDPGGPPSRCFEFIDAIWDHEGELDVDGELYGLGPNGGSMYTPLEIGAATRLHADARMALKLGLITTKDNALPDLIDLAERPQGALWESQPAPCPETRLMVKEAMACWAPARHFLWHSGVRHRVRVMLLVSTRLSAALMLPVLPGELWAFILGFVRRQHFRVKEHYTTELAKGRFVTSKVQKKKKTKKKKK